VTEGGANLQGGGQVRREFAEGTEEGSLEPIIVFLAWPVSCSGPGTRNMEGTVTA
jgi:hypothetical protein